MLDCELCTLTHSWVGGAELVLALALALALVLPLAPVLVPPLGLAAMKASRVAEAVPPDVEAVPPDVEAEVADDEAEVPDDDEPDADDGEPDCPDCAGEADADWFGPAVTLVAFVAGAAAVEELLEEEEVEGDGLGEGDGDGEGEGDGLGDGEGEGEGLGDADDGSAWHTAFVAVACGAAYAVSSRPMVRKPPLSNVIATTRTCPKRISIACLR
jgi:hypothetical protein